MYGDAGRLAKDRATGKPLLRPPTGRLPCVTCPKCQWGDKTPEEGRKAELTPRNQAALDAYYERRAAGGTVGPVYRRKFGIIERLLEEDARARQWRNVK
jgi:hypothetical protein